MLLLCLLITSLLVAEWTGRGRISLSSFWARRARRLLPALFVTVAPPGATDIPFTIGCWTLGITVISAIAAWTARETYRVHLNDLGNPNAVPVPKQEYDRMRAQTIAGARMANAAA